MSLIDQAIGRVKDDSAKLDFPDDYTSAVNEALKRYSKHRPRVTCADVPGQDGPDISLPADWVPDFSDIKSIEYPIGQVPESLITSADWRYYRTPTDIFIRFAAVRPESSGDVRLTYTVLHVESSVPVGDLDAVANLAASICCRMLSAKYGNSNDPIIQADAVNYQSKTDQYRRLADSLEDQYNEHLGLGKDAPVTAAMATAAPPAERTRWRLTHR